MVLRSLWGLYLCPLFHAVLLLNPTGPAASTTSALPLPVVHCRSAAPRLQVIMAGPGTSGTRSLSQALCSMGYRTSHQDAFFTKCGRNVKEACHNNKVTKVWLRRPTGSDRWRPAAWKMSQTAAAGTNPAAMQKLAKKLRAQHHAGRLLHDYAAVERNITQLAILMDTLARRAGTATDAVGDTPVDSLFTRLFATYGNTGVKVVLTSRNATVWARSRMTKHIFQYRCVGGEPLHMLKAAAVPYTQLGTKEISKSNPFDPYGCLLRGGAWHPAMAAVGQPTASEIRTYAADLEAYEALIKAIVPPAQLLVMDITAIPAREAWSKLETFLAGKSQLPYGDRFGGGVKSRYKESFWEHKHGGIKRP